MMPSFTVQNKSESKVAGTRLNTAPPIPTVDIATPIESPTIQRKTSCACGGGCPACQAKSGDIKVSQPNDPTEIEADQIADSVMRMPHVEPKPVTRPSNNSSTIQCKCNECEGEDETIHRKQLPSGSSVTDQSTTHVQKAISSDGRPLDRKTRSFFEPRLGHDLSAVRIHTGGTAAESAKAINARAFTVTNDIAFAANEYQPQTSSGKRVLAHELAHVVQGRRRDTDKTDIQRMCYGGDTGCQQAPLAHWVTDYNARPSPADEREAVVDNAIAMIRETVEHAERFPRCHAFFRENCPNGSADTLRQMFDQAVLWKADRSNALAFATQSGNNVAYTQAGYDTGDRRLAVTLVHELMHSCGVSGEVGEHHMADVAGLYCIGTQNQLSLALGVQLADSDRFLMMMSYRRLLADLGNGQLQLQAGADLNVTGLTTEITSLATGITPEASEFGAVMIGLRLRGGEDIETGEPSGFGGERFGGITARLETGFGAGRFHVGESRDSPPGSTRILPGFVVQAGMGAEFYIPAGVEALPLSLEATYRMVQPLNAEAERIHMLLGHIGMHF